MKAHQIGSEARSRHTHWIAIASAAFGAATLAPPAQAVDFSSGALTGSWDTTISYGMAFRIQDSDCNQIGIADGGCGRSPNIDDGDLNFGTGSYARTFKLTSEIGLNYGDFGLFVRGSALYDDYVENAPTERTPLTAHAKDLVGSYVRLLDAFAYWRPTIGGKPAEFRLGRQVVSWGESTFIQGGINNINHFDVAALRQPGAELKEGFLPQEMAFVSLGITENTSVEGLYLFDWNDTRPEPVGSYWSSNDFVPIGGSKVVLGFGGFSDQGVDFTPRRRTVHREFPGRAPWPDAGARRQRPIWRRVPHLLSGIHERHRVWPLLHQLSQPPAADFRAQRHAGRRRQCSRRGDCSAGRSASFRGRNRRGLPVQAAIATAAAVVTPVAVQASASRGGNLTAQTASQYATIGATQASLGVSASDIGRNATNIATHEFAQTAEYFTAIPGRHQAHRPELQHPVPEDRHCAAGRSVVPAGCAAAVRRCGALVCCVDATRERAVSVERTRGAVSHDLYCRAADTRALRPARTIRRQSGRHRVEDARYAAGAVHPDQGVREHPRRLAVRHGVRGCVYARQQLRGQARGRTQ